MNDTTTLTLPNMECTLRFRSPAYGSWREYNAKPRIYVRVGDFGLLEDLENRFRRPYRVFRPFVLQALIELGLAEPKISWSQNAGCSCGCSPGFIVQNDCTAIEGRRRWDLWITLEGVQSVDETKPSRLLVPALP